MRGGGDKRIYGVKFDGVNTAGTRMFDSVGLNFSPSSTTATGVDDFIKIKGSPFHIRECISDYNSTTGKQEVIAYEGDSNWNTLVANKTGNRMIEFPKFYYRRPNKWEFQVSSYPYDGFLPSPMHYRNGNLYDFCYLSKFLLNAQGISNIDQTITTSSGLDNARNLVRQQKMYLWDAASFYTLAILIFIKYNNLDVQRAIGYGNPGVTTTGLTSAILSKDGYAGSSSQDVANTICFGFENLCNGQNIWLDGITKNNRTDVWINTDIENIVSTPKRANGMDAYVKVTTKFVDVGKNWASGLVNDLSYDANYPWLLIPTGVSQSVSLDIQNPPSYNSTINPPLCMTYYSNFDQYENRMWAVCPTFNQASSIISIISDNSIVNTDPYHYHFRSQWFK